MTSPSVVEIQLQPLNISGGVNERERTETAGWGSSLATCENLVVDQDKSLVKKNGMALLATTDDASAAPYPTYRALNLRGNSFGFVGKTAQLYHWSDKYGVLMNKGKVSEFGVKEYDVGASANKDTGVSAIAGLIVRDQAIVLDSAMSSKFAAVMYMEPGDGVRAATARLVVSDRTSNQVIRSYKIPYTLAGGGTYQAVCTFVDDRYLHVAFSEAGALNSSVTVIDTTALPADLSAVVWSALSAIVLPTCMTMVNYPSYSITVITDGTNTDVCRTDNVGTVTVLGILNYVGTSVDCNGTDDTAYVVGINNTPLHELRTVTISTMAAIATVTSGLVKNGDYPRVAVNASGECRVISHYARGAAPARPSMAVYIVSGGTWTLSGDCMGWIEMGQPFCDRALTGRFYTIAGQSSWNNLGAPTPSAELVGNCAIIDISATAPALGTLNSFRPAAMIDNYAANLNSSSFILGGSRSYTSQRPQAYSNVVGFAFDKKIGDTTRAYTFAELTTIDPSKMHAAAEVMSGGLIQYYDGQIVQECGFVDRPSLELADSGIAGGPGAGTYKYVAVFTYCDATGKIHYSRVSPESTITMAGGNKINVRVSACYVTARDITFVSAKIYRTKNAGSQYYYAGTVSADVPATGYMTTFVDITTDANIGAQPLLYRQPGTPNTPLDRYYAPFSTHIARHKDRFFSASGTNVYYTSYDVDGYAPWWNPVFYIPIQGEGDVTGLASLDSTLIIFKRNSIYAIEGDGPPENGGTGTEFAPPYRVSAEYGCIDPRSIVITPVGVFFRSLRGIELITKKLQVTFVGNLVINTVNANPVITGAAHDRSNSRVIFNLAAATDAYGHVLSQTGVMLCYDLVGDIWTTWKPYQQNSPVALQDVVFCYNNSKDRLVFLDWYYPYYEDKSNKTDFVYFCPTKIETHWIKAQSAQDRIRLTDILYLAKKITNHAVKISIGYDYSSTYTYSKTWEPGSLNGIEELELQVPKPQGIAFRLKIEEIAPADTGTYPITTGHGAELLDVTVKVGQKGGGAKLPAAQKG